MSSTETRVTTDSDVRLRVGSAPDSWGVWFAEDDHQLPWHQFLDERAEADYDWLELGPYGYLPIDPRRLLDEVGKRGLRVSGGTVFGALHRPDLWNETVTTVRRVAELTAAVDGRHLVFIPPLFRDEKTGGFKESPELDAAGWKASPRARPSSARFCSRTTTCICSFIRTLIAMSVTVP